MYTNQFTVPPCDNRLLILDWASIGYQTLHGLASRIKREQSNTHKFNMKNNPLRTRGGTLHEYRNSHFSRVLEHIKIFNPTHVIIALEGKGNWRFEVLPEYKGTRKFSEWKFVITRKEFGIARDKLAHDISTMINSQAIQVDGAEGDDVMARAVEKFHSLYTEIVISSSDKDMIQLKKFPNVKIFNSKTYEYKEMEGRGRFFIETKILQGDKSDNILGMLLPGKKRRVGPKTASVIYESCNGNIYEKAEKEGWLDQYLKNKQLIDLEMIPDPIKHAIDLELEKPPTELCSYIESYGYNFTEYNMNRYTTLKASRNKALVRV